MDILVVIFLFVIWAIFGSFGSVLIWRLKAKVDLQVIKSILTGRSHCPNCDTALGASDLVPVFSRLLTWGRCAHCAKPISMFYPILELFSGIIFVFSYFITSSYLWYADFAQTSFIWHYIFFALVNRSFLLFIFSDMLFYEINLPIWLAITLMIIFVQFIWLTGNYVQAFWGGVSFFILFYLIFRFGVWYVRVRFGQKDTAWFGGGDVMMSFSIGLMIPFVLQLNWLGTENILILLLIYTLLSSVVGLIFSLVATLIARGQRGSSIPFLPAMVVSFWILLIWADVFVNFIDNLFY